VPFHITLSFKLSFERKGEREKVIGKKDNEIFDPRKILSALHGRVDKYLHKVRLSQTS
jgi:predicted nucleic acid-binding protein